jgi:hypothetical protein
MILTGTWAVHSGRIRPEAVRTRNAGEKAFGTHGWTAGRARFGTRSRGPGAVNRSNDTSYRAVEPIRSHLRKIIYLI